MTTYRSVPGSPRYSRMWAAHVRTDGRGVHAMRHVRKPGRVQRVRAGARYLGGHLK